MKKTNIEVEGGEILLQSKEGHYAIIPAKDRAKVKKMVDDKCDDCINNYIRRLPKESDYAEDGTLIEGFKNPFEAEVSTKENPIFADRKVDKVEFNIMPSMNVENNIQQPSSTNVDMSKTQEEFKLPTIKQEQQRRSDKTDKDLENIREDVRLQDVAKRRSENPMAKAVDESREFSKNLPFGARQVVETLTSPFKVADSIYKGMNPKYQDNKSSVGEDVVDFASLVMSAGMIPGGAVTGIGATTSKDMMKGIATEVFDEATMGARGIVEGASKGYKALSKSTDVANIADVTKPKLFPEGSIANKLSKNKISTIDNTITKVNQDIGGATTSVTRTNKIKYKDGSELQTFKAKGATDETIIAVKTTNGQITFESGTKYIDNPDITLRGKGNFLNPENKILVSNNEFTIKAEMGKATKEEIKFAMEEANKLLPEGHIILENKNASLKGIGTYEKQLQHGYTKLDEISKVGLSNADGSLDKVLEGIPYTQNKSDEFSSILFNNKEDANKALEKVQSYLSNSNPNIQTRIKLKDSKYIIEVDLPKLQKKAMSNLNTAVDNINSTSGFKMPSTKELKETYNHASEIIGKEIKYKLAKVFGLEDQHLSKLAESYYKNLDSPEVLKRWAGLKTKYGIDYEEAYNTSFKKFKDSYYRGNEPGKPGRTKLRDILFKKNDRVSMGGKDEYRVILDAENMYDSTQGVSGVDISKSVHGQSGYDVSWDEFDNAVATFAKENNISDIKKAEKLFETSSRRAIVNNKDNLGAFGTEKVAWHEIAHNINSKIISDSPEMKNAVGEIFYRNYGLLPDDGKINTILRTKKFKSLGLEENTARKLVEDAVKGDIGLGYKQDEVISIVGGVEKRYIDKGTSDLLMEIDKITTDLDGKMDYFNNPTEVWSYINTNLRQELKDWNYISNYHDEINLDIIDRIIKNGESDVLKQWGFTVKNYQKLVDLFNESTLSLAPFLMLIQGMEEDNQDTPSRERKKIKSTDLNNLKS